MARLILDSGAVIALAANQARARQFVERALRDRLLIVVPAPVVAETTRGGARDAPVNRVLRAIHEIAPVTEAVACEAGRLIAAANIAHATVDALIVAEAVLHGPSVVLTGDLRDMSALAANHPQLRIHPI
jgi:predicted nucleic acid-binding protein